MIFLMARLCSPSVGLLSDSRSLTLSLSPSISLPLYLSLPLSPWWIELNQPNFQRCSVVSSTLSAPLSIRYWSLHHTNHTTKASIIWWFKPNDCLSHVLFFILYKIILQCHRVRQQYLMFLCVYSLFLLGSRSSPVSTRQSLPCWMASWTTGRSGTTARRSTRPSSRPWRRRRRPRPQQAPKVGCLYIISIYKQ